MPSFGFSYSSMAVSLNVLFGALFLILGTPAAAPPERGPRKVPFTGVLGGWNEGLTTPSGASAPHLSASKAPHWAAAGAPNTVSSCSFTLSSISPVTVRNSTLISARSPGESTVFLVDAVAVPSRFPSAS